MPSVNVVEVSLETQYMKAFSVKSMHQLILMKLEMRFSLGLSFLDHQFSRLYYLGRPYSAASGMVIVIPSFSV